MPDASQAFSVTIPAGSGSVATHTTALPLPISNVTRCLLTWPAGCAGLVGVALMFAGTQQFPYVAGQFMAFDDFTYPFDITNQPTSGAWNLIGYNQDYYDHTIQVILEYDYIILGSGPATSALVSV